MRFVIIVTISIVFRAFKDVTSYSVARWNSTSTCGWDNSPVSVVYEGVAAIETYPWMGMLYYPMAKARFTTSVVVVTRQMVLAAASEIDRLPKTDFRAKARVVIGRKCESGQEIRIRDYIYHHDFYKYSYSALAMVQLEVDHLKTELRPICQPQAHFFEPEFFAMTVSASCKNPKVRIHRMKYVNINKCRNFYRRSGLGDASLWPRHVACARALTGGTCVWRSGSVLALKQEHRWRLLGFSVYGPGCGAPARFLDYGMYHQWVRRSAATVGQPAITRLADNHIVMRRSLAKMQRYGPCDTEEKTVELYTDKISIMYKPGYYHAKYNVSIYANVEYSCIIFKARSLEKQDYLQAGVSPQPHGFMGGHASPGTPVIKLRRWCATSAGMCHGFQNIQIDFYVDLTFSQSAELSVMAYGKEAVAISAAAAMKYTNANKGVYPDMLTYVRIFPLLKTEQFKKDNQWFLNS